MIQTILRRGVLFPFMLVGSPLLFFIAFCFEGFQGAIWHVKQILSEVWDGVI